MSRVGILQVAMNRMGFFRLSEQFVTLNSVIGHFITHLFKARLEFSLHCGIEDKTKPDTRGLIHGMAFGGFRGNSEF